MKGRRQNGEFNNWLKNNFKLTEHTARRFMQIADRFQSSQLPELLALPEAETEQFIEDMTVKKHCEEIQQWKNRAAQLTSERDNAWQALSEQKPIIQTPADTTLQTATR